MVQEAVTIPPTDLEKTTSQTQLRGSLQTPWPAHPRTGKAEGHGPRPEETGGPNIMRVLGQRGHWVKTKEIWIKCQL